MRVSLVRAARPPSLWVMRYFTRQWQLMAMLTLFLLLTVGFQLGIPQLLRRFLDAGLSGQAGIK